MGTLNIYSRKVPRTLRNKRLLSGDAYSNTTVGGGSSGGSSWLVNYFELVDGDFTVTEDLFASADLNVAVDLTVEGITTANDDLIINDRFVIDSRFGMELTSPNTEVANIVSLVSSGSISTASNNFGSIYGLAYGHESVTGAVSVLGTGKPLLNWGHAIYGVESGLTTFALSLTNGNMWVTGTLYVDGDFNVGNMYATSIETPLDGYEYFHEGNWDQLLDLSGYAEKAVQNTFTQRQIIDFDNNSVLSLQRSTGSQVGLFFNAFTGNYGKYLGNYQGELYWGVSSDYSTTDMLFHEGNANNASTNWTCDTLTATTVTTTSDGNSSQWNTAYTNNHTHTNKTVLDGIDATDVANWDGASSNSHSHSNKATLDTISSSTITNWNNASDARVTDFTWTSSTGDLFLERYNTTNFTLNLDGRYLELTDGGTVAGDTTFSGYLYTLRDGIRQSGTVNTEVSAIFLQYGYVDTTANNDFGTASGLVYGHTNAGTDTMGNSKPITDYDHAIYGVNSGATTFVLSYGTGDARFSGDLIVDGTFNVGDMLATSIQTPLNNYEYLTENNYTTYITAYEDTITKTGNANKFLTVNGTEDGWTFVTDDMLHDTAVGSNGILVRTGAGTYSVITDNSANWDLAEANVQSDWDSVGGDDFIKNKPGLNITNWDNASDARIVDFTWTSSTGNLFLERYNTTNFDINIDGRYLQLTAGGTVAGATTFSSAITASDYVLTSSKGVKFSSLDNTKVYGIHLFTGNTNTNDWGTAYGLAYGHHNNSTGTTALGGIKPMDLIGHTLYGLYNGVSKWALSCETGDLHLGGDLVVGGTFNGGDMLASSIQTPLGTYEYLTENNYDSYITAYEDVITKTGNANKILAVNGTADGWQFLTNNMHVHSNQSDLDGISTADINSWDSAATNSHTHSNKAILDGIDSTDISNWDGASSNSHTHSNKSDLDGISASTITNWNNASNQRVTDFTWTSSTGDLFLERYNDTNFTVNIDGRYLELTDGGTVAGNTTFSNYLYVGREGVTETGTVNTEIAGIFLQYGSVDTTANNDFGSAYGLVYGHTNAGTDTMGNSKPITGYDHAIYGVNNGATTFVLSYGTGDARFSGDLDVDGELTVGTFLATSIQTPIGNYEYLTENNYGTYLDADYQNVQSDWNQTDTGADDYINNIPGWNDHISYVSGDVQIDVTTIITRNADFQTHLRGDRIAIRNEYTGGGWGRALMQLENSGGTAYWYFGAYGSGQTHNYGFLGADYNNAAIKWDGSNNFAVALSGTTSPSYPFQVADNDFIVTSSGRVLVNTTTDNGTDDFQVNGSISATNTNWDSAYNNMITSAGWNSSTGVITLTQQDAGTVTVDIDGRYEPTLPTTGSGFLKYNGSNWYIAESEYSLTTHGHTSFSANINMNSNDFTSVGDIATSTVTLTGQKLSGIIGKVIAKSSVTTMAFELQNSSAATLGSLKSTATDTGIYTSTGEKGVVSVNNGATELYHDGVKCLHTTSTAGHVTVEGDLTADDFGLSSDRRFKTDIRNIDNIADADNIQWRQFLMKKNPTRLKYGAIADEVKQVYPDMVDEDEDGFEKVHYIDLLIVKIARLEQRIKQLEDDSSDR